METRTRTDRIQREIDTALAEGWRIESETPDRVVLVKRNYGDFGVHIVLALLTFWWTLGVGNLAYAAYKYVNDSQRRVLWESERECPECGTTVAPDANYCRNCGTELPTDPEPVGMTCPNCGAAVAEGAKYCSSCGAGIAEVMEGA
ncbi:zinc ribbon domain-containing protein [Haladaptatus halobius]|uniref:zinc ribbon domain-containing protein n=1 Tax=Haladaptatus halobius TaxID=2884875 RepID=UPI001D0B7E01|nr:zinc ribbon domain-containing protein [Haladaptatus halobius]